MLALLLTIVIFVGLIGLARTKLGGSPFRDYLYLPWGQMIDLPPQAEKVWADPVRKPSELAPEARQAPSHLLALLVNRDRLARPLLSMLIDMSMRGLLKITWNPRSEDFILQRQPIEDASKLSKLDRALMSKLFPNEATELTIEWRNSDLLGEARRLIERANKKRLGNTRISVPHPLMGGLLGAIALMIIFVIGRTEAGSSGYIVSFMTMIWPLLLLWTAGLAMKSKRASKATGVSRYQDRFYLMATLSLGICIMMLSSVVVLSIAVGVIGALAIVLSGFSIPLLRAWIRVSEKPGRGHKIAASWLQHFKAGERQESDLEAAKAKLAWRDLGAAVAVGAEHSWMAAAQLHVDISDPDEEGEEEPSAPIDQSIDPDNPSVKIPKALSFEQNPMPLLAFHHHITDGLWVDLWQALLLDYTIRLRDELPIGKKPKAVESKSA
ncbi:MAG: hypothetical protein KI792_02820 [Alphaproteobacteria bacterium]|nr:hypothetical protein [Alphaproteobacteria bacterium SS10]